LIPGVSTPARPAAAAPPATPAAAVRSAVLNRTMMGMPATMAPVPVVQARPAAPAIPDPAPEPSPQIPAAISTAVAQKIASIAARGPEYEAIAHLSREIIEQVVWEVVPELAELIIRQEIDRLASAKR
jgi:hypothetical protein